MRKLALCAGAALIVLGNVGSADAQYRRGYGYHGGVRGYPHVYRGSGWYGGGGLAAGLLGGLVLGGIAAAATAPAYPYPYGYGYGPSYGGGYYPVRPVRPYYGYPAAPYYGPGIAYSPDPYAAPHEVYGGYRTVYRPGYGRVIVGAPY